jgi:hypothetical protein
MVGSTFNDGGDANEENATILQFPGVEKKTNFCHGVKEHKRQRLESSN